MCFRRRDGLVMRFGLFAALIDDAKQLNWVLIIPYFDGVVVKPEDDWTCHFGRFFDECIYLWRLSLVLEVLFVSLST